MDAKSDGPALDTVAKKMGIPTDMLIFFGGEAFCLLCAILYHKFLSPGTVSASLRHVVAMVLGVCVGYFSFGLQFGHVVLQSSLCFVALQVLPPAVMHVAIFMIAMGYLISLHLYRAFAIPEEILYSIDVSGPLMIVTQKITILAFSFHDGCHGNKDKLSDLQKRYMISKPPSALEYFSYIFYFQGIVVGPLSFYKDYVAYVEGTDIARKGEKNKQVNNNYDSSSCKPSPYHSVVYKLSITLVWMIFHFTVKPQFPEVLNADPEFIAAHSVVYRIWYMLVSMLCCRAKYYVAFSLGDAICNASGFGFNGYDEKGNAKWNLITNVNIKGIEFATSFKMYIDNWNIQTSLWLRHVCYDRIPTNKIFATFFLSALWHGCYPGYYFTFISGAIFSEVWRKMRRKVRPYFVGSSSSQLWYDVMTWFSTHLYISYIVIPFTILHIRPTLTFFQRKVHPYFVGSSSSQLWYDVMMWFSTHLYISYIVIPFTILHIRPTLTFFHQLWYDMMMWFSTHLYISYIVIPFTILHIRPTLTFFHSVYWFLHVVSFALLLILPYIPTPRGGEPMKQEPGGKESQQGEPSSTLNHRMKGLEANGV